MTEPGTSTPPVGDDDDDVPLRLQCAVYGVGMFSTTIHFMMLVAVPLWVHDMMLTPLMLGIALGCRPVLSLFLSIHAGNLMDRIGGRRVMIFTATLALVTPALYPALPFLWTLIVLQLLSGAADSIGWLGAQTMVGQVLKGRTSYAGRLSAIIRIGHIVGPPLTGAVWDYWGPWAAFSVISFCGIGGLISAAMLPKAAPRTDGRAGAPETPAARFTLRDLVPDPAEYVSAFRMLATPAIAITVMVGMMVHVGNNIQGTFYIVWLNEVANIPGTLIGTLIAIASAAAAGGSLISAWLRRYIPPYWLLWFVIWMAIILIAVTPLLGSFVLFAVVLSLRSAFNGIHQPLVITLMLSTVGPNEKGKIIGLRGTANRVTSIAAPFLMGAIAQLITEITGDRTLGLEISLYIIGALSTVAMIFIAWRMTKHPEIHDIPRGNRGA